MNTQTILTASADYAALDRWLEERGVRHLLLVCDQAIAFLRLDGWFRALPERRSLLPLPLRPRWRLAQRSPDKSG